MENEFLKDEKEWLEESTKPIDSFLPILNKSLVFKLLILLIILIFLLIRFHKLFITIIAIVFISYIKFKRAKLAIDIEIEPSYLLAIALTFAFGINYGVLFIIMHMLVTVVNGVTIGLIVIIVNKIIVNYVTYFYWIQFHNVIYMIIIATTTVLATDIIGFFIRKKFGQPLPQIIPLLATNTIIRFCYFTLFLDFIVKMIK